MTDHSLSTIADTFDVHNTHSALPLDNSSEDDVSDYNHYGL